MEVNFKIKKRVKWLFFSIFLVFAVTFGTVAYKISQKNHQPKLSVIIPVYNVEEYLPRCLDSVIGQTFTDLEIICVNDGSPDNCLEILNEYKQKDSRILVIDKPNGGVSSARNAGMKVARAEYVTFVDSDDYLSDNVYETCMKAVVDKNADIVAFNSITEPSNEPTFKSFENKTFTDPFEAIDDREICNGYVWNKIFRHSLLVDNDIWFNENITYVEDELFVQLAFPKAKIITTCPDVFYHYQMRPNSACHVMPLEKSLVDAIVRINCLINFYTKEGYTNRYVWILDYCLAITRLRLDQMEDVQKRKQYAFETISILENNLLPEIKEPIPKYLTVIMNKFKDYANA